MTRAKDAIASTPAPTLIPTITGVANAAAGESPPSLWPSTSSVEVSEVGVVSAAAKSEEDVSDSMTVLFY